MGSIVQTELGWSCDSDYLVHDAGTYLATIYYDTSRRDFTKTSNGSAICVFFIIDTDNAAISWRGPLLISTNESSVAYTVGGTYGKDKSATINGVMWYMNGQSWTRTADPNETSPFPVYRAPIGIDFSTAATNILNEARVSGIYTGNTVSIPVKYKNLEASFDITVL